MPKTTKRYARKTNKKKIIRLKRPTRTAGSIFPKIKNCVFLYKEPFGSSITSIAATSTFFRWRCNDLYDFDYDNFLANKQPLYFDDLLKSTGPYHRYCVYAWKINIEVMNMTANPCDVMVDTGVLFSPAESDTTTEISNKPGVISKYITGINYQRPVAKFSYFGKLSKFIPTKNPEITQYGGLYNGSTSYPVVGTCLIRSVDGVSVPEVRAKISVKFYTKLLETDATQS